jgi:hypothetical protein
VKAVEAGEWYGDDAITRTGAGSRCLCRRDLNHGGADSLPRRRAISTGARFGIEAGAGAQTSGATSSRLTSTLERSEQGGSVVVQRMPDMSSGSL